MSYFREARCVELSIIDYIETQINANWTGITTVKAFQDAYKASLPVISVALGPIDPNKKEIGSTDTIEDYTINIDIFAKSDGQKIDLASFILTQLKVGCVYYEYSQTSGAPETLTKVANGRLRVTRFLGNYPVDFGGDGVNKYDQHRFFISCQVRRS
jgi:hypothetical protein